MADGYVAVGACVELPGTGGMGYHYVHPQLAGDTVVDPARPQLLVYYPDRRGRLRLGAVEYFVADADHDLSTDDDRPSLFGEFPFAGPMPGHDEDMPIHYDLHVWLYRANPRRAVGGLEPESDLPLDNPDHPAVAEVIRNLAGDRDGCSDRQRTLPR